MRVEVAFYSEYNLQLGTLDLSKFMLANLYSQQTGLLNKQVVCPGRVVIANTGLCTDTF